MKSRKVVIFVLLFLLLLGGACSGSQPEGETESASSNEDGLRALAQIDNVSYGKPDNMKALLASKIAYLNEGDLITVDDLGYAIIAISNSYVMELMRDGNLQLQEADLDEDSLLLVLAQTGGVSLNDFHPEEAVDSHLQIVSDYVLVTATGTYFLVVKEQNTPLQWVVALPDPDSELRVTADNTTVPVPAGKAVWIAPQGPPGPVFDANVSNVYTWIANLRSTGTASELGEAVWNPANIEIPLEDLPEPISVTEPVTLARIALTFDPQGFYEKTDCSGDGVADVYVQNGRIQLDFRQVIGQVRNIAVTVVNRQPESPLNLSGFNPANEIISEAELTSTQESNTETLTLFSPVQPYHSAELEIGEACLTGIRIIPPDGEELPVTPITPEIPPTNTSTPTPTAEICVISPPFGWIQYTVQSGDTLFNLANRTGTTIGMIMSVNCLPNTTIYLNQGLWLPFVPPTITPTNTPTLTPTSTPTITPTNTPTNTPTITPTNTPVTPVVPRQAACEVTAEIIDPPYTVGVNATTLQSGTEYDVYFIGDSAINVGMIYSGEGSEATGIFTIPEALRNYAQLSVGLLPPNSEGFLCEASFETYVTPEPVCTPAPPAPSSPFFAVTSVVPNLSVSILTYNLPADLEFTARMGRYGSQGIGGMVVDVFNSEEGGSLSKTFQIPENLFYEERLALRLESPEGYYAYTWFYNDFIDPCSQ